MTHELRSVFLSPRVLAFREREIENKASSTQIEREVKAKIKVSPVVVFGVLSRMVLVRESWDAPFLLESQSNKRSRAPRCPNHLITTPAGDNFHTKVQLEFNSSDRSAPKKVKQAIKLYPAGTMTRWLVYAGAVSKRLQHIGQSRSSVLL